MTNQTDYPKIVAASENALIVYFASTPDKAVSAQITAVQHIISKELGCDILDLVPSFNSLLVIYNALNTDHFVVARVIENACCTARQTQFQQTQGKLVTLPVYYAEESGPDLLTIANDKNISVDEVIKRHSAKEYQVYSIGFAPGFAYLGEVDPMIAAPRLQTPRKKVPKGAVAIADQQTAVYPSQSPGGWNIIGLCPTPLFDLSQTPAMPFNVGDRVCFKPIDKAEYLAQGGELHDI
ncbi:5-oxoprolinase subunit PxpB [Planctobacterium marinum]|uniref:5-oxoprolinase subunit PxpB n=1 Tax=Planctobacterium marinum TaxID=1631968 RepID=UPI001E409F80|nr:5-oxoprolinase subunit PxpB [Planctobacterium marinum]MCC2607437.1 5-oxoprolinase subunit PxpB [Planctobacterium marinum]